MALKITFEFAEGRKAQLEKMGIKSQKQIMQYYEGDGAKEIKGYLETKLKMFDDYLLGKRDSFAIDKYRPPVSNLFQ